MDNPQLGPASPPGQSALPGRSGRARRVVTTIAASAIMLGSGAAIGVALTSGASAATATPPSAAGPLAGRCAKIVQKLRSHPAFAASHPVLVMRLRAFCGNPLLRLAAVGGEYGQVTFQGKTSPKTVAFERGTINSVTGSSFTVQAADGTRWTWDLIASTKLREAGHPQAIVKLSTGEKVLVIGLVTDAGKDARLIQVRQAS